MTTYRDKTYCASPHCQNECGRKMLPEIAAIELQRNNQWMSYAYFCGSPITNNLVINNDFVTDRRE